MFWTNILVWSYDDIVRINKDLDNFELLDYNILIN